MPRGLLKSSSSWRKLQPTWEYAFHSDSDNAELIATHYRWLLPTFSRLSGVQKADVSRVVYMHHFGGVYADLDMELLKPLRPLLLQQWRLRNASVLLGQEPIAHAALLENRPRQVCNAILVSAKGHPFWLTVLRRIMRTPRGITDPVASTGPRMLEMAVEDWHASHGDQSARASRRRRRDGGHGGVVVLPPDTFFPTWDPMQAGTFRARCTRGSLSLARGGEQLSRLRSRACERLRRESFLPAITPDAFTNHRWVHTWIPGAQKVDLRDLVESKAG